MDLSFTVIFAGRPLTFHQKVIFMTSDSLTRNIPDFVNKAGCRLLEKPFTTDELITAGQKHMSGVLCVLLF